MDRSSRAVLRSQLALRLFLVVNYVLRVLREVIVGVERLERDLAGRGVFCALRYSLQRGTQTPDSIDLVWHSLTRRLPHL